MHRTIRYFLFLIFTIQVTAPAYPDTLFGDLLNPEEDYTAIFPGIIIMNGFFFGCYNEVSGPLEIVIRNNHSAGGFEFAIRSPLATASLVLDKHLQAQFSETVFPCTSEKYIKKAGHDRRLYYREETENDTDRIILTLYRQEQIKKRKTFSCNRNMFPTDTVMIICQALLLKGIKKDFMIDVLSLEDALIARMDMIYYLTDDPCSLSAGFDFPPNISDAIHPDETYHVFGMKPHGLLALFVRSAWYFVYRTVAPYHFVAYWGGDGVKAETIYMTENGACRDNDT